MDRRRLELWATIATIALYIAAAASLVIFLGENLLQEGTRAQRIFAATANHLNRLGGIGGGSIVAVILLIRVGGGTWVLFIRAYDNYQENKQRRERERAEWRAQAIAEGLAEGLAKGRAQGRAEILEQLRDRGVNVDDLLPPSDPSDESSAVP